jgi:hypothetical protein
VFHAFGLFFHKTIKLFVYFENQVKKHENFDFSVIQALADQSEIAIFEPESE